MFRFYSELICTSFHKMQYIIYKYHYDDPYFSIAMNPRALRRLDSLFLIYVHSLPESFCSPKSNKWQNAGRVGLTQEQNSGPTQGQKVQISRRRLEPSPGRKINSFQYAVRNKDLLIYVLLLHSHNNLIPYKPIVTKLKR